MEIHSSTFDVAVVGAGMAGLASAWRAAQSGLRVVVLERDHPGAGASSVAAGMLAPVTEADFGEDELLRLNLESVAMWPAFAKELEELTGIGTGYERSGALAVAADRDDAAELRRVHELQTSLGLDARWLVPSEARGLEPGLAPRIAGAIDAPGDAQADPIAVLAALERALLDAGGEIRTGADVVALRTDGGRVRGAEVSTGEFVPAGCVVLAAGCWSGGVGGLPGHAVPRVRPVKGQLLHLRTRPGAEPLAGRIVRSPRVYVVPRPDGRVIVGATSEERGFDTTVDAGAIHRLLEAAWEILPDVWELEFEGATAGLRPGTPDNRPLVGPSAVEGLVLATGHYRNGVLLAPVTAERVVEAIALQKVAA